MGPLLDVYVQRNSDKDGKYLIANWDYLDRIQTEVNSTRVDKGVTLDLVLDHTSPRSWAARGRAALGQDAPGGPASAACDFLSR